MVGKCIAEINDSGMFSIVADTAVDISNVEQMPIVVRYVDINNDKNVKEHCVCMVECREGYQEIIFLEQFCLILNISCIWV